jgi:hypothetical protein
MYFELLMAFAEIPLRLRPVANCLLRTEPER